MELLDDRFVQPQDFSAHPRIHNRGSRPEPSVSRANALTLDH